MTMGLLLLLLLTLLQSAGRQIWQHGALVHGGVEAQRKDPGYLRDKRIRFHEGFEIAIARK